jgi:hypothetical protein
VGVEVVLEADSAESELEFAVTTLSPSVDAVPLVCTTPVPLGDGVATAGVGVAAGTTAVVVGATL